MHPASQNRACLDDVLATERLQRTTRLPDYERENRALTDLAQAMADQPKAILQRLTAIVMEVFGAGSAGISLLHGEGDQATFDWPAIAGAWKPHIGGGLPFDASPCGIVVQREAAQLFVLPERHFRYMVMIDHPIREALLAPFCVNGKPMGTVWVIMHDDSRRFDGEDARLLNSLSRFAAAAYQTNEAIREAESRQFAVTESDSHLRRSLETLSNLIQKSPFGVCVVNSQFHLEHANEGAKEALRNVHPLIGRDYDEVLRTIWPESYAREISARFRHTLETGEPYKAPEVLEDREDTQEVESYDWRLERITLPDGKYGVVCYFYDLSDIKRVQRELRHRSEQFQTLLNQAPLGMYLVDADFRLAQVNPIAMPVFEMADVIGRDFAEVLHSMWPLSRAEMLVQVFRRTLETGEPVHFPEFAEQRSDRHVTEYYDWRAERIVLPDGRYGVVCYFRDISEQVSARRAIAESEERLRVAAAASRLGLHDFNVQTGTVEWDQRTRELWGVRPDETITYELWRHSLHPDDREQAEQAVRHALDPRGHGAYKAQYRVTNRVDRITRWIEATGQTTFLGGTPIRLVGTVQDVSERKEAERTLQEADRRKDEFLATLAHELRNPLAAIRMALGVLAHADKDPARIDEMKAIIDRQSSQLMRLIDDLLDVSRITRGKIELRMSEVDVAHVIEHAAEAVCVTCRNKNIELAVRLPEHPILVRADSLRLSQVLGNLLNNACKFTEDGGRVEISAARDGSDAVVRVRDTGIGIDQEQIAHIFDMFVQVNMGTGPTGGGLGIGLALARTIITMHGGTIEAHSEGHGRGSEFVVRLPAVDAGPPKHAPSSKNGLDAGASVPSRRVLVVDDNRDALHAVQAMLRMSGHAVEIAEDGESALEKIHAARPDIVLLDIGLPGIDGYEVARRIRRQPLGRDVAIIAVTGWGQERDKQQASQAGFDAHLTKPVEPEQLEQVLLQNIEASPR